MKKQSRKLNLNRETLIPLQSTELDGINGGAISPLTSQLTPSIVTRVLCPTLSVPSTGVSLVNNGK